VRPALATLSTLSWLPASHRQFLNSLDPSWGDQGLKPGIRHAFRTDLWLLLTIGMGRMDLAHPWLFDRCREIQASPDGHLDLWARDHYKSTIITFGKTVQDILASHGDAPLAEWDGLEPTFGIFSHTRPIAKAFIRQIKVELERNRLLQDLFPDVLYGKPDRDAPRWSEDSGLVVRRRTNPKEATVEAWGLVDGQPTGKHFDVLIYDDVVSREAVGSPEMIGKTTKAWEDSLNLGTKNTRRRMIGTRWHFADTYRSIMERGAAKPRIYPATDDGTLTGKPVLLTQEQFTEKVRDMGPYVAAAQLLLDPTVDSKQRFLREWFSHQFDPSTGWRAMNRAIICDPASGKKDSDYTAIVVLGIGPDSNLYLLDLVRDRLTLAQRGSEYLRLHRLWEMGNQWAGYEQYGLTADIEYLKERMDRETYHFDITELKGKLSKFDRVNRLIPLAAEGRLWLPEAIRKTNCEGKLEDLVQVIVEQEFLAWPVPPHDDAIDAISRFFDMEVPTPMPVVPERKDDRYSRKKQASGWMAG
jgi:phage terminase large subunit-like protein